jgi:hypothetical protein
MRYTLAVVAGLCLAAPLRAAGWADDMFEDLSKYFGTVPHGTILYYPFRLTNKTGQPVHISSVRVSCGCVTAWAARNDVAPGESTVINARMDTHRFWNHRAVTIFVNFDRPQWEETRLSVSAESRDDLLFSPEELNFGTVRRGSSAKATATITFVGSDTQITKIDRGSNYIDTALSDPNRQNGDSQYSLTASIRPDTPAGKWFTEIWLKTNNAAMPRIRIPLNVEIDQSQAQQSPLVLSAAPVLLGQVKPGDEAERQITLRGPKPFTIKKVQGTDDELTVSDDSSGNKVVHVLTVRLKPTRTGEIDRRVKIITDLNQEGVIEFQAKAKVVER